jgi:hypothetical protein
MPACPSLIELENYLAGQWADWTLAHLAQCPPCEARLLELRANLACEAEIRDALGPAPTPPSPLPPPSQRSPPAGASE